MDSLTVKMSEHSRIREREGSRAARRALSRARWESGNLNRAVGFTSLLLCVVSGMVIGLWSFGGPLPTPESVGEYGDLPRRFLRLGHIAFFGIGILNLVLAGQSSRLRFSGNARYHALVMMNLGNIGLPPLLLAAAWQPALMYLLPAPVLCIFGALGLTVIAAWRALSPPIASSQGGPHD
jgi:hypothetical protein